MTLGEFENLELCSMQSDFDVRGLVGKLLVSGTTYPKMVHSVLLVLELYAVENGVVLIHLLQRYKSTVFLWNKTR